MTLFYFLGGFRMKKNALRCLVVWIVLTIIIGNVIVSADNNEPYYLMRDNTVAVDEIYEVEYVGGKFIAVGYDGIIKSSDDGENWVGGITKSYSNLHGAAWGNGRYIVVGDFGTILESSDAVTWVKQPSSWIHFRDIVFGKDKFVATGAYGEVYYSADGVVWKYIPTSFKGHLESIIWDGNQFVTVGDNGTVLRSTDGLNWSILETNIKNTLRGIAYNGSTYVAVGDNGFAATSSDLKNWIVLSKLTTKPLNNITYGGGRFVISGGDGDSRDGSIYCSTDGVDWICVGSALGCGYYGVAWGKDKFVAAGGSWGEMSIVTSSDGMTWKEEFAGYNINLHDIAKSQDMLVAVGDNGTILYSRDGISWSKGESATSKSIQSIVYGNGKFIAFADGEIISSTDGIHWLRVITGFMGPYERAVWGNNKFVAASVSGNVLTSGDGEHWNSIKLSDFNMYLQGVAFGNGVFAVLDRKGMIYTSTDGMNWTQKRQIDKSNDIFMEYTSISWVKDKFIAYKNQEKEDALVVSNDSELWTETQMAPIDCDAIQDIAYENGVFIAVGLNGTDLYSHEGSNWYSISDGYGTSLNRVLWYGDHYIGVGNHGNIVSIIRKSNMADIESTVFNVDNDRCIIENIPANMTIDKFVEQVKLSDGATYKLLQFDGRSDVVTSTLRTGMKFIVVSEDKSRSVEYMLIVNKRADAELSSNIYKINSEKMIIEKLFAGTDYLKFISSFKKSEGASLKVTHGNRVITSGLVYPGMKLTVTSEDGTVQKTYVLNKAPVNVYIDKKLVAMSRSALTNNNTIIAPAEELVKALGAAYMVDAKTGEIKIKGKNVTIYTYIGAKTAKIAGKEIKMQVDVKLIGVPYMSLQFLAEKLGYHINLTAQAIAFI